MVASDFLSVIAAVFVAVVALEGGDPTLREAASRPADLDRQWQLARENRRRPHDRRRRRTAALRRDQLRRYPQFKLGLGIAAAAALGFGSFFTSGKSATPRLAGARWRGVRRGVSHRVQRIRAVRLSARPAGAWACWCSRPIGAGVFAVSRSALSLAVLRWWARSSRRPSRWRIRARRWSTATTWPSALLTLHGRGARLASADPPEFPVHAGRQRILRVDRRLFLARPMPQCCCR